PRAQQPRPVDFDAARPQAAARRQAPQREATQRQAAQLEAIEHAIDAVDQRAPQARNEVAELDEANMFNGEFEIEASAPRLAANDINDKGAADREHAGESQDVGAD